MGALLKGAVKSHGVFSANNATGRGEMGELFMLGSGDNTDGIEPLNIRLHSLTHADKRRFFIYRHGLET